MGKFVQLVVDGLSTGSIYGAIALAIVLVNQATGLINFAQGGMAVLSAYVAWWLTTHGVPLILAILAVDRLLASCSAPWSSGGSSGGSSAATPTPPSSSRSGC